MMYDVQIYINDAQLPLFGAQSLTPARLVEYLSGVLYRQAQLNKKLFRISVCESGVSSRLVKQGTLNFPPFKDLEFKFKNKK